MECVTCVNVWLWAGWEVLVVRGLGLDFTNPGGTWGKWDMCQCYGCGGVGGVGREWVGGLGPGNEGWVGWCYVCVCCESGLFVFMAGPCICIIC